MRYYLLTISLVFAFFLGYGQCPTVANFTSQAQINQFAIDYPDCTELNLVMEISGNDIVDLSPFSNLESVLGMNIINNPQLVSLVGLESLEEFTSHLYLWENENLASLQGLNNVVSIFTISIIDSPSLEVIDNLDALEVASFVEISNLSSLTSLEGLANASMVDLYLSNTTSLTTLNSLQGNSSELDFLDLTNNSALVSLAGLENVQSILDILISNNDSLESLEGLSPNTLSSLFIDGNDSLLNLNGLESLTQADDFNQLFINIEDNLVLADISSLVNIGPDVDLDITITGNSALSECAVAAVCQAIAAEFPVEFQNNSPGCNTLEEVDQVCRPCNYPVVLNSQEDVNNFPIIYADCSSQLLNGLTINGDDITDLSPLIIISSIEGGLEVSGNTVLTSLQGLENINSVDVINVFDNPMLQLCVFENICNHFSSGGQGFVDNNAPGCNSVDDVLASCENLNKIIGTIYFDFNSDGCDVSDFAASNILVTTSNGVNTFTSQTDENGNFELFTFTGIYVSEVIVASLPEGFSASPNIITSEFVDIGNEEEIAFCIEADEIINDVSASLIPLQEPRPGVAANYVIQYENRGTQLMSGDITLEYDETIMFFTDSEIAPITSEEGMLIWNYENLLPFESRTFITSFELLIPPDVEGGEELNSSLVITPLEGDVVVSDNTIALSEIVVNSFDPNDKQVLQGEDIYEEQVGDFLDYLVRFQNTGTADALEVVVTDTLSSNLDWSTLRILSASHEYRVEITNENEVAFIFEDINLPPEEVDEEGSNGHIAFEIRTNNNLVLGDSVENTANIFFDFNPPIITNTVVTTVAEPLGIDDFIDDENILIYPNPTSDILIVKLNEGSNTFELSLLNLNGQVVKSVSTELLDMSGLGNGVYFLKIKTDQGTFTRKVIKK